MELKASDPEMTFCTYKGADGDECLVVRGETL